MNNKFKEMIFVFNAGEVELHKQVVGLLEQAGYRVDANIFPNAPNEHGIIIGTDLDGVISSECKSKEVGPWYKRKLTAHEEINLDWMRPIKQEEETISLGGKTYIKSELEEALSHINPVDK